jgi:hypothetical protein
MIHLDTSVLENNNGVVDDNIVVGIIERAFVPFSWIFEWTPILSSVYDWISSLVLYRKLAIVDCLSKHNGLIASENNTNEVANLHVIKSKPGEAVCRRKEASVDKYVVALAYKQEK